MYGMTVHGETKDIEMLASYMKGEQERKLAGVRTDETYYGNHHGLHVINGGCKTAVELSMLGTEDSYYYQSDDKTGLTTLEQLTKELNLYIDLSGDEDFGERYIINKGVIEYEAV
jgi:hypothetical protein